MKTIVIYHQSDFDGILCREIAKKFLPDAELIGWDYGHPIPAVPMDTALYILDLSVDRLMTHPNLIWIDHHKSAIEKYPLPIRGYRIDGVAACRLAWQWFTKMQESALAFAGLPAKQAYLDRTVTEPWAVRLAGEYDIWDKRDPDAELFQHGLRSCNMDERWARLLGSHELDAKICVNTLLKNGETLQYAREMEYAEVIQQQGFDTKMGDLVFLACNSHELDIRSHLFAAGVKPHHDGLLGFTWTGKHWRVSLYHAAGKEAHDLSLIAVKYGGGGHRGACGFTCKELPFPL